MKALRVLLPFAVAIVAFVPPIASATTYVGNRLVGTGSADILITTDGTIGTLAAGDIIDWRITVKNGGDSYTLLGPLAGNNSALGLVGSGLSATSTDLLFNFDYQAVGYTFALFQRGMVGSSESFYCLDTSGCGELGESLLAAPNRFVGNVTSSPRSGVHVIASVSPPTAPLVNTFTANPSTITSGQSSTLSWTTTNATTVSISGVTGTQPANGSVSVSPIATTTYTLTATGPAGTATATTMISVTASTTPLSITTTTLAGATVGVGYAEPVEVSGGQTPYTWSVSTGLPPGLAINATSGAIFGTPTVAGTFSFTVTVGDSSSPPQSVSKELSIVCASAQSPTIVFTASPARILQGASTTLSWSASNATTVIIDNELGARTTSGSVIVQPGRTTQYVLTAVGPGGSAFRALRRR